MRRIIVTCAVAAVFSYVFVSTSGTQRALAQSKKAAKVAPAPTYGNADAITEEELKVYDYFLASDQLEGRYFPSRGYDTAALYVASHLAEWGLKPGGSSTGTNGPLQPYFMPIEMVAREIVPDDSKATLVSPAPAGGGRGFGGQGGGVPADAAGAAGAAAAGGAAGGAPGGPGAGGPGAAAKGTATGRGPGGGGGRGAVDPATQLERSALPGIKAAKISFFLAYADLDPATMGSFIDTVKDQLVMAGKTPTVAVFKDHSHMSEVFSPGSPDTSVSAPILKWMKGVK